MSVSLLKSNPKLPISQAATTDPIERLRQSVASRIFDAYCNSGLRQELLRYGVAELGLQADKAVLVIDMELEALACANEHQLCLDLTELLHRFTDKDKKLDAKERMDAIQMVCKSKFNYSKGLAFDIAEAQVLAFCRANRVRVKTGIFRWDIP